MALRVDDVDLQRDRDLVRRYQHGDPDAFDDLYRRYFRRLRSFCRRHVNDDHAAEELAQEAFVKAYRSMSTFGGEQRFYPWMTVIAKRLCIDHHRRHGRVEPSDDIDPGMVENELEHLEAEIDRHHLVAALERLGPRHRGVLALREGRGLTYQEIADELEVPVTTVEALLHRARKALRREFATVASEGRGLWGVPLFAWFARRAGSLRARVAERTGELVAVAAPAAAGLATAAIIFVPGGESEPAPDQLTPSPVVEVTTPDAPPIPGDVPIVSDETGPPAPEEAPATVTDPVPVQEDAAPPEPTAEVSGVDVFVGEEGTDEARRRADDMPTRGTLGPATAGFDPTNAAGDLLDAVYTPQPDDDDEGIFP